MTRIIPHVFVVVVVNTERRSIRIDSLAGHRCNIGIAVGVMCCFIGRCGKTLEMRTDFILGMRFACCNWVMAYVRIISIELGSSGRLVVRSILCFFIVQVVLYNKKLIEFPFNSNSMDPADYLVSEAPKDLPTDVLLYYTQCESVRSNPFTLRLRESQNAINNARSAMNIVSR